MKGQCQASVAHVQIMCGAGVFSKKYYCNDWRRFAIQCGQKSKFVLNQAQAPMPDHCTLSLRLVLGKVCALVPKVCGPRHFLLPQ